MLDEIINASQTRRGDIELYIRVCVALRQTSKHAFRMLDLISLGGTIDDRLV